MAKEIVHNQDTVYFLPLKNIRESTTNPRKHFDSDKLNELAESIKTVGVIQPITVRKLSFTEELTKNAGTAPIPFEIVSGHRRFRASKIAKKSDIRALVVEMGEREAMDIQAIENLQREDLSPMEEAEWYYMMNQHAEYRMTVEAIGAKIGKKPRLIRERLQLMKLIPKAQKALYDGVINLGIAQVLARIEDEDNQEKAFKLCDESTTIEELKSEIERNLFIALKGATFKLDDLTILPSAGACIACPHNSTNRAELFEDLKDGGVCTKPSCFKEKTNNWAKQIMDKEEAKGRKILTAVEAGKIFSRWSSDGFNNGAHWVNVNDICYDHPKKLTYKQIIKEMEGEVSEYVGFNYDKKLRHIYKKSEFQNLVKNEKWMKKTASGGKGTTTDNGRDRRRQEIIDDLRKKKIIDVVMKRKLEGKLLHDILLEAVNSQMFWDEDDMKLLGLTLPKEITGNGDFDFVRSIYAKHSNEDKFKLDLLVLALTENDFDNIIKTYKIDMKPVTAAAKKLEAAEWDAKKKADAAAKKSGKGTKAVPVAEPDEDEIDTDEDDE